MVFKATATILIAAASTSAAHANCLGKEPGKYNYTGSFSKPPRIVSFEFSSPSMKENCEIIEKNNHKQPPYNELRSRNTEVIAKCGKLLVNQYHAGPARFDDRELLIAPSSKLSTAVTATPSRIDSTKRQGGFNTMTWDSHLYEMHCTAEGQYDIFVRKYKANTPKNEIIWTKTAIFTPIKYQ